MTKVTFWVVSFPKHLNAGLACLVRLYPDLISLSNGTHKISFIQELNSVGYQIQKNDDQIQITYNDAVSAFRAFGEVLSLESSLAETIIGRPRFKKTGVMFDLSRNAVYKVKYFESVMGKLALAGVGVLYLYLEDLFQLAGEPEFGYKRGAYSKEELLEIVSMAKNFEMEVVPCIQTLGHLEQVLQWPKYHNLRDTHGILLASDEGSLQLVEKMIKLFSEIVPNGRIHLGMDEAIGLGLGRYLLQHGHQVATEILLAHLQKITNLCIENSLTPMIWSDGLFRSQGGAVSVYQEEASEYIIKNLDSKIEIVYWDYYAIEKDDYDKIIKHHRKLKNKTVFAAGGWSWGRFLPSFDFARSAYSVGLEACSENNIEEVFLTLWLDDGAECYPESHWPVVFDFINFCFENNMPANLKKQCEVFSGFDLSFFEKAVTLDAVPRAILDGLSKPNLSKRILWSDPMLGHLDADRFRLKGYYADTLDELSALSCKAEKTHFEKMVLALNEVLILKSDLFIELLILYKKEAKQSWPILREEILQLKEAVIKLQSYHRSIWYDLYKPNGWEVLDIRYAGVVGRLDSVLYRFDQWALGNLTVMEELEEKLCKVIEKPDKHPYTYRRCMSPSYHWTGFTY